MKQSAAAWNQWRAANPGVTPGLMGADLRSAEYTQMDGIDLGGADLFQAQLQNAHLRKADLHQADLRQAKLLECKFWGANLESARLDNAEVGTSDFTGANLTKASLRGVDLHRADLTAAEFRNAELQGANLKVERGVLRPEQLAGADLTGAQLPDSIRKLFDDLKAVGEISENARKLFSAMLAACLYCWLTIATTTDVNLITNRSSSPLPVIQTSIPVVGFYVVAPPLLLCVYFYFHFYLQKLWEELGSLPAIFPDGRPLHARSDPWLLNDLVRSHVARLKADRPFMSYFQQAISIVLAWWLVPITLFLFWGRYLPRHDFRWTALQVALLAVSITGAIRLYHLAANTLRGSERRSFFGIRALKNIQAYAASLIFLVTGGVFMLVSVGAIRGAPPLNVPWRVRAPGPWGWAPRIMVRLNYSPFANLRQADVSIKPPNWTGNDEKELELVKGAELDRDDYGGDLRYADMSGAFLAKANLDSAWLQGADLSDSDLRQANLHYSRLDGANLKGSKLNGAYLTRASLNWADLERADLRGGAFLIGTYLNCADLIGAKLSGAHMFGVQLNEATLDQADLTGADLTRAHLNGTYLGEADLTKARLMGADLTKARLMGADLKFADFRTKVYKPGRRGFQTRGLTSNELKKAENWDKAYYDDDVLKILFPNDWCDHNQKLAEEQKREEQQEAQAAAGNIHPQAGQKPGLSGKPPKPNQENR